ncbi:FKBP-type peptidyl-prolyl cis-trans isomerase [Inmirania thermothiophila]|uniref:Peptidyl-prolyl cis-trans isomerase n=1 Tax=Inmirania thermothiophila TaxID=1750597 RepID=A0A3N1Y8S7_9GAMM|nr:FKBP-type peptidyl-prolyl cis-trans isomerase [Inmirania thermothiophila]ROR35160.1 FKBP-type peptidyl-prolyl cis-trans isomerase FklB [Inmirania thermothiophila]
MTRHLALAAAVLAAAGAWAAAPGGEDEKAGYAVGYRIGQGLKRDGLPLDPAAAAAGLRDALEGKPPQVSGEEMGASLQVLQQRMAQRRAQAAEDNAAAGKAFQEAFASKAGVTRLDNGLAWRVIKEGKGPTPGPQDTVVVHYRGRLVDGTEFDSSFRRGEPATFRLDQVIPGWQEALQRMPAGSEWEVVIPPELAYGARGAGNVIGPNATLVFDIQLLEVKGR